MSLLDIGGEAAIAATPRYVPPPKPKTSVWADVGNVMTAVPRGIAEGLGAQPLGTLADIAGAYRAIRDATPEQRKQIDRQGVPVENFSSGLGDALRDRGRELRPDPQTATTAEQLLYGFARGASKIIAGAVAGGIPGIVAMGAEEAFSVSDDLRQQGVDANTRGKAGLVQGAGLALAALPAAGTTLQSTLALYAAGGPGGFLAQQALTREILQSAGYDKIGAGFDPLDPVGLAVASLIPAGFAAYGFRQAKIKQAVKDLPDLPPRTAPDAQPVSAADTLPPSRLSPIADAVQRYPQEVQDAARVLYQAEVREAANPAAGMDSANQHAAALAKAEDQMARGEPVSVADVAPAPDAPFKAWFDGSKVVDAEGKPLRVYHGTKDDVAAFLPGMGHFASNPDVPNAFASSGDDGGNVIPVFLSIKNPLRVDDPGYWLGSAFLRQLVEKGVLSQAEADNWKSASMASNRTSYERFSDLLDVIGAKGYDGLVYNNTFEGGGDAYKPFKSSQIKSAIGNTRFDPTSGSLTDSPYATWAEQVSAAIREIRAAAEEAKPKRAPAVEIDPKGGTPEQFARFYEATKPEPEISATAAPARLEAIKADFPDLMVMLDGMDAPMRMDDFLAAAKAEADEMAADAPLMRAAAQCALTFGA